MNSIHNKIHEWAETLPFEELNHSQQLQVLDAMSMEEYIDLYESNKAFDTFLLTEKYSVTPNKKSLIGLKEAVNNKKKKKIAAAFWLRPVPMYVPLAACLAFLFVSMLFLIKKDNVEAPFVKGNTLVEIIKDTIYVDRPIVKKVVEKVYVKNSKPENIQSVPFYKKQEESTFMQVVAPVPDAKGIENSFGNSPVDLASLEQFKVQM